MAVLVTFDPRAPDFAARRSEVYRWLRDEAPVFHDVPRNTWIISRYEDCFGAASDPATFSNFTETARRLMPSIGFMDAPRHTELRRLVSRAFTPARVASMESGTRALVDELLGRFLAAGGGDLLGEFSGPYAATVVGRMIGIPPERLDEFRHETDVLLVAGATGNLQDALPAIKTVYAAFEQLLGERRAAPADDLMSALLDVQRDGGLSDDEVLGFCFILVSGGNDTTSNLIANGWVMLLEHPDAMAEVRADRSLLPGAMEEMLRLNPPAESHHRVAMRDIELHGEVIPAGASVQVLWGAANLDEREFERPEEFDIHRSDARHLSFGHGPHFCLGASLARLEARLAFEALLDRATDLVLVEAPARLASPWACAYERVQLQAAS